jgi:hypothetical protein
MGGGIDNDLGYLLRRHPFAEGGTIAVETLPQSRIALANRVVEDPGELTETVGIVEVAVGEAGDTDM